MTGRSHLLEILAALYRASLNELEARVDDRTSTPATRDAVEAAEMESARARARALVILDREGLAP